MKKYVIISIYLVLVLFATAPILSVITASVIANACGARLDEGNVHPCIVFGHDIGLLLYDMFVAGWLMLFTIPVGVIAILGFTVALLIAKFIHDAG